MVGYSITGGADAANLEIDRTTGVLTFVNTPDYETKDEYEVTVTAGDGYFNKTEQNIWITF